MRNKILSAFCIALIISLESSSCNAQLISNKVNIFTGYQTGGFQGSNTINENNFIHPSLYTNFNNLDGFTLKIQYNLSKYFSFGISFSRLQASNWKYSDSLLYHGSQVIMHSFSAYIRMHTKLAETGPWNRIKLFLDISPTVGISKLSLTNPLFDIQEGSSLIPQPAGSSNMYYGLKGNLGAEVSITQMIGVYIDYSYGNYKVSSLLYTENHFADNIIEAGFVVKLLKNKRYFY